MTALEIVEAPPQGKIGALSAELAQIRRQSDDLSSRATAAWRKINDLRAGGALLPDNEAEAAAQQVLRQRYESEIAKLESRKRHLEDKSSDAQRERREYQQARKATQV